MRCSSVVCPFQWVWGTFYRQRGRLSAWAQYHKCGRVKGCGWPCDPPPLALNAPDHCSWGGWESVPCVGFARYDSWEVQPAFLVWSALLCAMWLTAFAQGCLGLPWNDSCGGGSAGQVDPLIQVILTSSIKSNRHFLGRSRSSNLCPQEMRCIGPGTSHGAGAVAPGRAGCTCRAGVPSPCGTLVLISPKMCTCPWKSQHKSWNFIGTKNVHETCHILLSNPRYWLSIFCCKDRQQSLPS
jgi:hypothetical protein